MTHGTPCAPFEVPFSGPFPLVAPTLSQIFPTMTRTKKTMKTTKKTSHGITKKSNPNHNKMVVGEKTSTSKKYHVLITGDCDVADVFHYMETGVSDVSDLPCSRVLIFGETDKRYGGFKDGRMGEYFSVTNGRITGRIDWEDGIDLVQNKGYTVYHVKNRFIKRFPGYEARPVVI